MNLVIIGSISEPKPELPLPPMEFNGVVFRHSGSLLEFGLDCTGYGEYVCRASSEPLQAFSPTEKT